MNYFVSKEKDVLIVNVELTRATTEFSLELKNLLFEKIDNDSVTKIVINLSKTEFTDSSFLGALVSGLKKISNIKGDIKICNLQPAVRTMFELTRLYKVFELHPSLEEAVNSFN